MWVGAADNLRSLGFDVTTTAIWERDPGDDEILAAAALDDRVLITLDKDFGELAILRGVAHAGIVRLVDFAAVEQGAAAAGALRRYADELRAGAIVTVERFRVRVRPGSGPSAS